MKARLRGRKPSSLLVLAAERGRRGREPSATLPVPRLAGRFRPAGLICATRSYDRIDRSSVPTVNQLVRKGRKNPKAKVKTQAAE